MFEIPFLGRAHEYLDTEVDAAVLAMRDAVPLTQGRHLREFEEKFRRYVGVNRAFAVNNATAALEIAARLCQLELGDEVIIPAHTYTSSAYPFLRSGAQPMWADIDSDTRVISVNTIAPLIGSKTRAIVVPHLYGFGADMPEIMALADQHGLIVIEDAAQAMGVRINGQAAGTFGHMGVYSFHSHKNMTTLGEGGMLVVREPQWADLVPIIRHNGHRPYAEVRSDYWIPAMTDVVLPELNGQQIWPMNCCLGEVESAVGVKLIDRVDRINSEKRIRAISIIDALADYPEMVFHREMSDRHNYHLLAAQLKRDLRDNFIRRMAEHHGIQCVVQYYPLNRYPLYRDLGFGDATVPNTDAFFDNMVSLPFNHLLTEIQIEKIIAASIETLQFLRR